MPWPSVSHNRGLLIKLKEHTRQLNYLSIRAFFGFKANLILVGF